MIRNIIREIIKNPVLANLLMLVIVICGIMGAVLMPKELMPVITLNSVSVRTVYPGADPEEVEEAVTAKIEEAIDGIEGIDEVRSESTRGLSMVTIDVVESADQRKVKEDIEKAVDNIFTFPNDVETPIVSENEIKTSVVTVVVEADELSEEQLKELSRELKDELLSSSPDVTQAVLYGPRNYEISIEIKEEKLRQLGLSFTDVTKAVVENTQDIPSGTIRTNLENFTIKVKGRKYLPMEYLSIPIMATANGSIITLGQIAEVTSGFDEDADVRVYLDGNKVFAIDIFKTNAEDAIKVSQAVNNFIARKNATLPANIRLYAVRDSSKYISQRLVMLLKNGISGLLLVFFILWLFLDIRLSFWVTLGVPVSIMGGMAMVWLSGSSLNIISTFGLIMVLGIIVDDAIVVGESIYHRRKNGDGMLDSAAIGTSDVALPVIASVLTTVFAFMPLFFVEGTMGKMILQLPTPVVAALLISLVESLFILPVHLRHLPVPGTEVLHRIKRIPNIIRQKTSETLDYFIQHVYGKKLQKVLHYRYVALMVSVVILMITMGMVKGGIIKFLFQMENDQEIIIAKVELASGTPLEETERALKQVMSGWRQVEASFASELDGRPMALSVFTIVGSDVGASSVVGSNKFSITIELMAAEERNIYFKRILARWQEFVGDIPGADLISFTSQERGPGGDPIGIRIKSQNTDNLLKATDEVMAKFKSFNNVYDVQNDYRIGNRELMITMKPYAAKYGITQADVSNFIRNGFYGDDAIRVQRDRDDVKVRIRFPQLAGRNSLEFLTNLYLPTPQGNWVPLGSIANYKFREASSVIRRINGARTVKVTANANTQEVNPNEIMSDLRKNFFPKIAAKYNVIFEDEGTSREQNKSLGKLFLVGFPMALLAVYVIIASIFQSYIQPLIIMITVPFGIIGASLAHLLFGYSLTMMSLFGFVALAGVVVNDSIVLIEGINSRLSVGITLYDAICEGAQRRFRAILLTTLTTFFGLIPIMLERSLQAEMLKPMALTMAFGVLFATVLTLILIPCLVAILNDLRCLLYVFRYNRRPIKEEVEPRFAVKAVGKDD